MYPIKKEDKPECVRVLEILKQRLQKRYELAAGRQTNGIIPSRYMRGLSDSIQEIDQLLQEKAGWNPSPPQIHLSVMESQTTLSEGVILQSWFTRMGQDIIRSELYFLGDGSVVAYQDCVNGVNEPLYVDGIFKALYEDEPVFGAILHYAGVHDSSKIELYYTGR